jgi:hypothetical protein
MSTTKRNRVVWDELRGQIEALPRGRVVRVPRGHLPHPRDAGARLTTTWPAGQIADYAIDGKPGEAPVVVREFANYFEAFLDGVSLTTQAADAAASSPTAAMYLGGALLGGAIGSSVSNKRESVLVGAALGMLFGALVDVTLNSGGGRRGEGGAPT